MEAQKEDESELAKLAEERRKKFTDPVAAKKAASSSPTEPATPPVHEEGAAATTPAEYRFKPLVDFFSLEELKVAVLFLIPADCVLMPPCVVCRT